MYGGSEMIEDGSIRNTVMAQHKVKLMWTAEMEDQLVDLWQQHECLFNVAISSCISSAMHTLKSSQICLSFLILASGAKTHLCQNKRALQYQVCLSDPT